MLNLKRTAATAVQRMAKKSAYMVEATSEFEIQEANT